MNIDEKRVVVICDRSRYDNSGRINWQLAKSLLDYEFGEEKSWEAWRGIYRRASAKMSETDIETLGEPKQRTERTETSDTTKNSGVKRISVEMGSNGTQKSEILIDIVEHPLKTPKDILVLHGYDIAQWELVNHKMKIWNTYSKLDGTSELYSSAVTVKPINLNITSNAITELFESLHSKIEYNENFRILLDHKYESNKEHLFELGIYDVHYGKFAWHKETNNDFDLKIADELYRNSVIDLFDKASLYKLERILIVFGNDFFHYDNYQQTTTGGTKQDTDTRMQKMFEKGCDAIVWTIEYAKQFSDNIDFLFVPSNHDYTLGYFAASLVRRLYLNDNKVKYLYCSPISRKYYHYYNALIGFAHGDKETKDNIKTLMQYEEPELWAKTYIHEWHLGHFHSEKTDSYNGIVVRNLPSITATDLWHFQKGWVGAVRKSVAFLWEQDGSKMTIESLVKKDLKE